MKPLMIKFIIKGFSYKMKITKMKTKLSIFLLLTLLMACSNTEPAIKDDSSIFKAFNVTYKDKIYHGFINSQTKTITIGGIEYGEQVTAINYSLKEGAEITPEPRDFVRNLSNNQNFTITFNGLSETYTLLLTNYIAKYEGDRPKDESWILAWEDEFNGTEINWSVWSKTPRGTPDWNNTMSNAEELYQLRDGKLVLRAIANTSYPEDDSPYLTGGIWGLNKKTFALGRIDVRARFDSGQGFWPAIWMMGENAPWPTGGEIDIMEHLNFDDFVYQTVHSDYTNNVSKTNPASHGVPRINKSEFNIYSVEVHENEVVFLINDEVTFRYPKLSPVVENQFPFTERNYFLILSAQLGGSWVGNVNQTQLPLEMEVDWVRFYEKDN